MTNRKEQPFRVEDFWVRIVVRIVVDDSNGNGDQVAGSDGDSIDVRGFNAQAIHSENVISRALSLVDAPYARCIHP